jgi:transketolase
VDIRDAFFGQLYNIISKDKNVIFLTADMGANDLVRIKNDFPNQFYNVGISEQNMISVAAGLALSGKKVYTYTIGAFYQRCFEQIKVDICGMNLPVTMIAGCVGLSNATDGSTHHCINDISIMRTLPNLTICNPNEATMASYCADISYLALQPSYIRLDKGEFKPYVNNIFTDTVIIATGNMVETAMKLGYQVINMSILKPLDNQLLSILIKDAKQIITLEEHLTCGLGSIISEFLTDNNLNIPLKRMGIDSRPCPVGDRAYLQKFYGLDVESIREVLCN